MSSGFITETEIEEAKKVRQEEWDKVRNPEDPIERPEEPYDARSLFERLQEQKQKKDLEYEEAHKLKNMIKGLDDDEIEFLDLVDRTKLAADRKKEIEEEIELNDYRSRVATLQEKSLDERLQAEIAVNKRKASSTRTSQQKLLKGIVVRKRKISDDNTDNGNVPKVTKVDAEGPGLKCVAILPGLGCYNDSSSDENSSDSEIETQPSTGRIDILGRKILEKTKDA